MKLQDRVALITGGGRGIGKAIALTFAREGASIIAVSRTQREITETAREVESIGRGAIPLTCNVASREEVEGMVEKALKKMGKIDILVNNAGIQKAIGPLADNDPALWIEDIHTNLIGTFLCTRAVLPHMIRRSYGKIINVAGGGAVFPRPNFTAYGCSKAAIVRLTETLAVEVKSSHIEVNALSPGGVSTQMNEEVLAAGSIAGEQALAWATRVRKEGSSPQPAAELALFLASDESNGLTGKLIQVSDDWKTLADRIDQIMATDLYTMRRIT